MHLMVIARPEITAKSYCQSCDVLGALGGPQAYGHAEQQLALAIVEEYRAERIF
jgi:hypothetical protein